MATMVEKFNHYAGPPSMRCRGCGKNRVGIRQDLFGFADILAVDPVNQQTIAVQASAGGDLSRRRKKLLGIDTVRLCYLAGWRIELHAWAKRKVVRGGKAIRFELIREVLTMEPDGTLGFTRVE